MGRTTSTATERLSLSLQQRVLDLADREAALIGSERSSFLRLLIGRAMGQVQLERSKEAPRRYPFDKGKRPPEMARLEMLVRPDQKVWLENLSEVSGGVPVSALLSLLILDWAGINPINGWSYQLPTRRPIGGR
jgi:hypothetical protein